MFFRECKSCKCPLDPGEGTNGYCDECLEELDRKQDRRKEVASMILATGCKQMEMEEFLNG